MISQPEPYLTWRGSMTTILALFVWAASGLQMQRVVVAGATGRVGRKVVSELLNKTNVQSVTAVVRDRKKAATVLPLDNDKLTVSDATLTNKASLEGLCRDADCIVWCATGFSDGGSPLARIRSVVGLLGGPENSFDVRALKNLGETVAKTDCRAVVCSSAGVTRPAWSDDKKAKYVGAADIPIVRLNPLNILDIKRNAEDALRTTADGRYTVVRPTGLNDDWPAGRLVVSQGDLAVGRISRQDVATILAALAVDVDPAAANAKTFEVFAVPLPPQRALEDQLARLHRDDDDGATTDAALDTTYQLLQQLVPGETLRPQALAMGQTYEQLDEGQTGRLGERGNEQVPAFVRS